MEYFNNESGSGLEHSAVHCVHSAYIMDPDGWAVRHLRDKILDQEFRGDGLKCPSLLLITTNLLLPP